MNNALVKSDGNRLFLTEYDWQSDYTNKKYRFIHLTISNGLNGMHLSAVDIFMLASSRLMTQGEFIVRFESESEKNHSDFLALANVFDFECLTNGDKALSQYVFRFKGKETKAGYAMMQAKSHSNSCIALFKDVFSASISKEFWHWKYPADKEAQSVVALRNNEVIAHYGFCSRSIIYNGYIYGGTQVCDVMVAASDRGAFSSSIFCELAMLALTPFAANNSKVIVAYGFPHGRHFKLGARLKLYSPVSTIWSVVFDIPTAFPCNALGVEGHRAELIVVDLAIKDEIDFSLKVMFSEKDTLLLKRDYMYLLQRYVHHPEYKYEIYRFDECYFIIKPSKKIIFLMDYIGSLECYSQKLNEFIYFLSKKYPGQTLYLWCLEDISNSFINPKSVVDTGAVFVNKTYSNESPDFKRWWVTMGDTEFL